MSNHRGDDLDDDFVPDDVVALSADEVPESDNAPSDIDLPNGDNNTGNTAAAPKKKRKRKERSDARKAKVCISISSFMLQLIPFCFLNKEREIRTTR
jgi:protein CMS1